MADVLEWLLTLLADTFGARRLWAVVVSMAAMAVVAALFGLVTLVVVGADSRAMNGSGRTRSRG